MQHTETTIIRHAGMATVHFHGERSEHVDVVLQDPGVGTQDSDLVARAKAITAFGTRDGGSLNVYDALSNGNLDPGEPLVEEPSSPPIDDAKRPR